MTVNALQAFMIDFGASNQVKANDAMNIINYASLNSPVTFRRFL